VARIGWQLAAGADQKGVNRFAQARELALVVQHDRLDAGALANQAEQPRFAAAGVRLNKQACVDRPAPGDRVPTSRR